MVITILEAEIQPSKGQELEDSFKTAIQELEPGIVETFLARDSKATSTWRIITVWESQQALQAMRQTGEIPRGVQMFRAVGAEPKLAVLDVAAHGQARR